MVAYSFQRRFVGPILAGTKRQTIRGQRRRHARPGEALQLYTGLRTRQAKLIARPTCLDVLTVRLSFSPEGGASEPFEVAGDLLSPEQMADFARRDGFEGVADMAAFWRLHHGPGAFEGVLILWRPN